MCEKLLAYWRKLLVSLSGSFTSESSCSRPTKLEVSTGRLPRGARFAGPAGFTPPRRSRRSEAGGNLYPQTDPEVRTSPSDFLLVP